MSSTPIPIDEQPNVLQASIAERRTARRERWKLLRCRPGFIIGSFIVTFWTVCAVLGDRITPFDPRKDRDGLMCGRAPCAPSSEHWLGTDKIGRDILSRIMMGARDLLLVAPPAAVLAIIAGTVLGMLMGYYRGWLDNVLSRFVEAFLALPVVLIALLVLTLSAKSDILDAISFGSRKVLIIYVVALLFTPIVARTVRATVIGERDLDYVVSAKLRGESNLFIMTREVLPNITGPLIVELTVRIGYSIFTVATLSFLGVGLQRPSPDWGLAISEGRDLIIADQWWPVTFPALAIGTLVIAVNLIADSIQEVFQR